MAEIDINYLLEIQEKYNTMIQKKKELNKIYIAKWRENISDDDFKRRKSLANKKYADKMKAMKNEQKQLEM